MSDDKVFEGKNLEEALQAASSALGIPEDDLHYEMVEQGRRGLFGLGAKSVRIKIMPPLTEISPNELLGSPPARPRRRDKSGNRNQVRQRQERQPGQERQQVTERQPGPERQGAPNRGARSRQGPADGPQGEKGAQNQGAAPRPEGRRRSRRSRRGRGGAGVAGGAANAEGDGERGERSSRAARPKRQRDEAPAKPVSAEDAQAVETMLNKMIELMDLDLQVSIGSTGGPLTLELEGEDRRRLKEKNAELLLAMQFVLNRMARRTWPEISRIHLSCNGRDESRDDDLMELGREVAQQVSRTREAKLLEPMNAYERRLIHLAVREFDDVESTSEGDGSLKQVLIAPRQ